VAADGVDGLLGELRAGGAVDSQGRFTLDRAKAREKLQKFQLVDARRYVLELVQAAVLRGATDVAFDIDADDMRMRFDGQAFTAEELDDLWGSIFADGDGAPLRGLRQLALGLNAALGLGPKRIVVRSGDQELRLVPGQADALRTVDEAIAGTTVHVVQRVALATVVGFFRNIGGRLAEEVHLRERCRYAGIEVALDGVKIAFGATIEGALGEQKIAERGVRGAVAVTARDGPAELRLIKDGVWIDTHELEGCGPGIVAVVEADELRKDVSLAKIVADEGLGRIVGLVRAERWGALARWIEAQKVRDPLLRPVETRVRAEVLQFLRLRDLRKRADAAIVAEALVWTDARTHGPRERKLTLGDLAAAVVPAKDGAGKDGAGTLMYAGQSYRELAAEGAPIPVIHEDERSALRRVLACQLVACDAELKLADTRAKARRAWRLRTTAARLPEHRRYLVRAPLTVEGMTGEVGLDAEALDAKVQAEGTTWAIREGCLLAELKLQWGFAGLDVAVEAMFTPTDDYANVARDELVVRLGLGVLRALRGLLAVVAEGTRGSEVEATVRGLIKKWMMHLFDADTRADLWKRLRVAEALWPDEAAVRAVLPGPADLDEDANAWLLREPLFEDYDFTRRSLGDLQWRVAHVGHIDELDWSVAREPGLGHKVAWLGRGDRAILTAMFGAAALRSWAPTLQARLREKKFREQRLERPEVAATRVWREFEREKVETDKLCRMVAADGVVGAIRLVCGDELPTESDGLRSGRIELMVDERSLVVRALDLGIGPIVGVASAPGLRANESWDDVVDDEALKAVKRALADAAWDIVRTALAGLVWPRKWATRWLLHRLALADREMVEMRLPAALTTPLLATSGGGEISVAELEAVIAKHREIAWVDAATVEELDPPALHEAPRVLAAVRALVGEALVGGEKRLQQVTRQARFSELPVVEEIAVEPQRVLFTMPMAGGTPRVEGEMGLCRVRVDGGLRLELCARGRRVGIVEEPAVSVACEAILADDELPLTVNGQVDTRSKRYGLHVRRCRRMIYGLVSELGVRFKGLRDAERAQARALLLGFVKAERADEARREARQQAWEIVQKLPLLVDVWGQERTLAEVEAYAKLQGAIEVVRTEVEAPASAATVGRIIVRLDAAAEAGLAGVARLRELDARWAEEVQAMTALAEAPKVAVTDLRGSTWVDRKATITGGLQAHLWVSRTPSAGDAVVLTRGEREVGRVTPIPGVACGGILSGVGMIAGKDGALLDARQLASLGKQVCMLVEALAKQVEAGGRRMDAGDRERAKAWLIEVDAALGRADAKLAAALGKPLTQLRETLAELVPPAVRRARAEARGERAKQVEAPREEVAEEVEEVAPPVARRAEPEVVTQGRAEAAEVKAAESEVAAQTPEQALLAAVRDELAWARARHGSLLERLRLDRLSLGTGDAKRIAAFAGGVVLHRRHPLISRQLERLAAGRGLDPIDLMFVVSAVYTLMNAVAEEIDAEDERAYVARLAESLALGLG
jgi:hypothetical protein